MVGAAKQQAKAVSELTILEFLGRVGKLGFPLGNMLHNDLRNAAPSDLLVMLRTLETKGFVRISGPRTLDDFAGLIEERSASIVTLEQQRAATHAGNTNHYILFHDEPGFFQTQIRPTLRGLLALAFCKATKNDKAAGLITIGNTPQPMTAGAASNGLIAKREAEKRAAETARPVQAFEHVVYALGRSEDKDGELWDAATEYWEEEEWAALATHKRLMESSAVYKDAFESFRRNGAKLGITMDAAVERINISENPFNNAALSAAFAVVAHPFVARKYGRAFETMKDAHAAERDAGRTKEWLLGDDPLKPAKPS